MYDNVKISGKSLREIQAMLNYEFSLGELYRMLFIDKTPLKTHLNFNKCSCQDLRDFVLLLA